MINQSPIQTVRDKLYKKGIIRNRFLKDKHTIQDDVVKPYKDVEELKWWQLWWTPQNQQQRPEQYAYHLKRVEATHKQINEYVQEVKAKKS